MKVMANYGVKFEHDKLNADRLTAMGMDLQNCVMAIDEIHVLLDSRNSISKRNKLLTYFILQTRKRGVVLMFTTQDEGQVDLRLRRNVDFWVYCRRLRRQCKSCRKRQTSHQQCHTFVYTCFNGLTGAKMWMRQMDGRKSYSLYDTEETITDFVGVE